MIQNYSGMTERFLSIGKNGLTSNKKEWSDLQMKLARKRKAFHTETGGSILGPAGTSSEASTAPFGE
jgi:hypothetical protein